MTAYWRDDAACSTATAGLFDPVGMEGDEALAERVKQAAAICRTCPVIDGCRRIGLAGESGIFAGVMLERGRPVPPRKKGGARPRRVQPCGTYAAYMRHRYQGTPRCDPCRAAYAKRRAGERARAA